mgnify:CR=1 FL=1
MTRCTISPARGWLLLALASATAGAFSPPAAAWAQTTRPASPAAAETRPAGETPKARIALKTLSAKIDNPANRNPMPEVPQRARSLVLQARRELARKDYAEAIGRLDRAIGFAPEHPLILKMLGVAYAGLPDPGRAERNLLASATQAPDDLQVWMLLGQLAGRNRQFDEAIVRLMTALKTSQARPANPLAAETLLQLGRVLQEQGYYSAALDAYDQLGEWIEEHGSEYTDRLSLRPLLLQPEAMLVLRGQLYKELGELEKARKLLRRARALNRADLRAAELLFQTLLAAEAHDDARALLVELATAPRQLRQVPRLVGLLVEATGDMTLPLEVFRAASEDDPPEALAVAMADLSRKLGREDQAAEILETLLKAMPGNLAAARQLALLHARAGRTEQALTRLAGLLASQPEAMNDIDETLALLAEGRIEKDLPERFAQQAERSEEKPRFAFHYVAGRLAEELDHTDLAARQYGLASKARPTFMPAHAALMDIYIRKGQLDQAQKLLERIGTAGGDSPLLPFLRGKLMLAKGDEDQAIEALAKAVERDGENLSALVLLADAYQQAGRTVEAIGTLRRAMQAQPGNAEVANKLFDLYITRQEFAQANGVVEAFLAERPASRKGALMQVALYMRTGREDQAQAILKELADQAGDDPDVLVMQAQMASRDTRELMDRKTFQATVEKLTKASEADENNKQALTLLANLHARAGLYKQAAAYWERLYASPMLRNQVSRLYARDLIRSDQFEQAETVLREMIRRDPADRAARLRLLAVLEKRERYKDALKLLSQWRAESANDDEIRTNRLMSMELLGQAEDYPAMHELLDAWIAEEGPLAPRLREQKLQAYIQAGQIKQADAYAETLIKKHDADALAIGQSLAGGYMLAEKFQKAAELYKDLIDQAKTQPDRFDLRLRYMAALSEAKAGPAAREQARQWIRQTAQRRQALAGEAAPKSSDENQLLIDHLLNLRMMVIASYQNADDTDGVVDQLRAWLAEDQAARAAGDARQADPPAPRSRPATRPTTKPAAPEARSPRSRPTTAPTPATAPAAEPIALSDSARTWCRDLLAGMLAYQKKYAEALKLTEAFLKDDPTNVDLLNLKSTCQQELGRMDQAVATLESAIKAARTAAERATTANNLAYLYSVRGTHLTEAEQLVLQAIRVQETSAFVDTLGWVLYKKGEFGRAGMVFVQLLEQIEDTSESHPVMHDHAGDVLWRLGWQQRAIEAWKQAVRTAKDDEHPSSEVQSILGKTPKKIQAAEAGQAPALAPLGEGAPLP